ncbi:hypothetical protein [Marinomonas sp. ef1]|uniref:hypothetical protein n=1 Tax=Marinomonas sp. ef1 TaxID=2005043 RepID=UPI000C28DE01|nr:hypothetical protein [Marinomonas sp. ef1]
MTNQNQEFTPSTNPMTDTAQDIFATVLNQRLQSGVLEQAITKKVDALIEDVASDVFRSYGDVGKALKEQFSKAIMPTLESMGDLPTYHEFVSNRLKLAAQNFYDNRLTEVMDAELKEIMSELPEEITLSWLVEKIIKEAQEDEDEPEGEITLIIEERRYGSFINIYLDKEAGKEKRECDYDLHLHQNKETTKWEIIGLRVNGREAGARLSIGNLYNTDKILFNIYAMKGQIELDQGDDADDYETSWSKWD